MRNAMQMKVNMENCYGIGQLNHKFNFAETNIYLIYAQNGVFKTSFAKTLKCLIDGNVPKDEIFPDRHPKAEVFLCRENEEESLNRENSIVFDSYDESFSSKESISAFVASETLKRDYEAIMSGLEKRKKELIKNMKNDTYSSDCEKEILKIFSNQNFYEILSEHLDEIEKTTQEYSFKYHDLFDDKGKVWEFLKDNQELLDKYFNRHSELLSKSKLYKNTDNGVFGTHQVQELKKVLGDGRFFSANHQLLIADEKIGTNEEFETLIQQQLEEVLQDQDLKKIFEEIDKKIKNSELKKFKDAVHNDNTLLLKLKKYEDFRKEVIFSYLNKHFESVQGLANKYLEDKARIQEIIEEARKEQEDWKRIIATFNSRFFVPFRIEIANQEDLILRGTETAVFDFKFTDEDQEQKIQDKKLKEILSQGEKRALYILQIIFEIESRIKRGIKTLLVFDDIADSFDYRNKYAIIEYLNDLKESDLFNMIVMTHNFDFYRTLASRLSIKREYIKMADKNKRVIKIEEGKYLKDFVGYLLTQETNRAFITLIPFVRNIIQYKKTNNESNKSDYEILTKCLHIKHKDQQICEIQAYEVLEIFKKVLDYHQEIPKEISIFRMIDDEARKIIEEKKPDNIKLENKIVLSIATRLKAEEFMFGKLSENDDKDFKYNQTRRLFKKVKNELKEEEKEIIHRILILVSENIHINSFMYEPILDTSLEHLIKCYNDLEKVMCKF